MAAPKGIYISASKDELAGKYELRVALARIAT